MRLSFVKYTKDEREPFVQEHGGQNRDGSYYHTISSEYNTYYTACYTCDTDLDTLNTDDKFILSLLKRKGKEMNGNGIAGYIKAVNMGMITKQLTDFKPYRIETYDRKSEQKFIGGMMRELNTLTSTKAYNQIKIAYKSNGEYKFLDVSHSLYDDTEESMNLWNSRKDSEKFYTYDFFELEKNVWKTLYRLKAKGYIDERYVKGSVGKNRRGRYYGVSAKRFYTINEKGIEYLKSI